LSVCPALSWQNKNEKTCSTAESILSAVKGALASYGASSVTTVGHSLGAALSLLDGVFLRLQLDPSVTVSMVGYGMPRVGNQAFVDFVDGQLAGLVTHINNKEDPIPILPGRFLGFHHPSGEVHIQDSGAWDACPGASRLDLSHAPSFLISSVVPMYGYLLCTFQVKTILLLCASSAMSQISSRET
jgi:hypothetical protein